MSSRSRRSDVTILAVLGGVSLLVIAALVLWGPLGSEGERAITVRTTHSTNTEGVKVYYVLLERLGFAVSRSERPFDAGGLMKLGVLAVLNPLIPLRDAELLALRAWVSDGGVLVFTTDCDGLMRLWGGDALLPEGICSDDRPAWEAHKATPSSSPATANVKGILLPAEVGEAEFGSSTTIPIQDSEAGDTRRTEVLYGDQFGPRIAARAQGKGWLIPVADSSFLSNGRIGRASNSVLAANLAACARSRARGAPISFDEYHLGFGVRESGWQVMGFLLFHTSPGWGVLVLTAAGVLWLIYKGRRFGRRRGVKRSRRRSKLEYVYSVGATYRSAKAERIVLEQILQGFRHRASELVGASPNASARELARQLSRRSGRSPEYYERVLLQCERAISGPHVSPRHFSEMLDGLAAVEMETLDAHARSQ